MFCVTYYLFNTNYYGTYSNFNNISLTRSGLYMFRINHIYLLQQIMHKIKCLFCVILKIAAVLVHGSPAESKLNTHPAI